MLKKNGPEEIVYSGKIFQVVKQPMKAGDKEIMFETARRSPGVRIIIVDGDKMLLTKEFRSEIDGFDYRFPGGRVFDHIDEYSKHIGEDILPFAQKAVAWEAKEEAGIIPKNIIHFQNTHAGSSVTWDLIYFIVDEFELNPNGQELEDGETISVEWKTFTEVKELCANGGFQEARSLGMLFKFFLKHPDRYDPSTE